MKKGRGSANAGRFQHPMIKYRYEANIKEAQKATEATGKEVDPEPVKVRFMESGKKGTPIRKHTGPNRHERREREATSMRPDDPSLNPMDRNPRTKRSLTRRRADRRKKR